ncbi:energy-coupling factor transporter ATPase [Acholeplasma sp. OttesenSCG-928-E16]|nr:energy-coupling factor transporter ATPase [Acholeplasma sp. OttesenSCG-928-E16]
MSKNIDIIKVEDLTFKYSDVNVLSNVTFTIEKGKWVSIIGHNGSGKSTLAKLLVGLLEADKGKIYINNLEMNEKNILDIRKVIGIVFQNPDNQFVGVTVKHDIAFGLENKRVPRDEMISIIDRVLKEVGMEKYIDTEPHNLSGGEKQRVAIAGSLAMDQDIIIFDEATSMLDPEGTEDIINTIKKLNKEMNKTVITITHDLDFAGLSDQIIVLNNGKIMLNDIVSEVFKHEDKLKEAGLEVPMNLSLYNMVKNDEGLSQNKELVEALWTLSSKK